MIDMLTIVGIFYHFNARKLSPLSVCVGVGRSRRTKRNQRTIMGAATLQNLTFCIYIKRID